MTIHGIVVLAYGCGQLNVTTELVYNNRQEAIMLQTNNTAGGVRSVHWQLAEGRAHGRRLVGGAAHLARAAWLLAGVEGAVVRQRHSGARHHGTWTGRTHRLATALAGTGVAIAPAMRAATKKRTALNCMVVRVGEGGGPADERSRRGQQAARWVRRPRHAHLVGSGRMWLRMWQARM